MTRAYNTVRQLFRGTAIFLTVLAPAVHAQDDLPYTTYTSFSQILAGRNARYSAITRVSDPGANKHRAYSGFFFYQCLQFDATGRYLLGMRVYVQNRVVEPSDRGDIGFIDLKNKFKWTKIGETTAWNWQQGARLQWRPKSDEIVWNDRSCEEAMSSYRARRQAEALAAQSRPCGYADFARPYLLAQGLALANGTES